MTPSRTMALLPFATIAPNEGGFEVILATEASVDAGAHPLDLLLHLLVPPCLRQKETFGGDVVYLRKQGGWRLATAHMIPCRRTESLESVVPRDRLPFRENQRWRHISLAGHFAGRVAIHSRFLTFRARWVVCTAGGAIRHGNSPTRWMRGRGCATQEII